MKKLLIIAAVALLGATQLKAQDCTEICLPFFNNDMEALNNYPAPKLEFRCNFSKHALYVTDSVQPGCPVFDLSELTNKMTGQHPDQNMAVDLMHLSYYTYNFEFFQHKSYYTHVYFRTPGSDHRYLGVRDVNEIFALCDKDAVDAATNKK
ncbi:MAG: hypothetical protein MJZ51_00940 [Bacteroidales bacterium]|nr:hypothetical protein [Bacteroidales bacterium]